MDTFPDRLRAARMAKGLSQVALANLMRVDPIVISRYERGKVMPHTKRATDLARLLDVSLDWLLVDPTTISSPPTAA